MLPQPLFLPLLLQLPFLQTLQQLLSLQPLFLQSLRRPLFLQLPLQQLLQQLLLQPLVLPLVLQQAQMPFACPLRSRHLFALPHLLREIILPLQLLLRSNDGRQRWRRAAVASCSGGGVRGGGVRGGGVRGGVVARTFSRNQRCHVERQVGRLVFL